MDFANDSLRFVLSDEGSGPPVVLLHGFPQDLRSWDTVVPHLHRGGARTLRFDQRGYTSSARPTRTRDYRVARLVSDVLALLDSAQLQQVHLVGHDWGGAVAWAVACSHPQRVQTLTVLSTPHPTAFLQALPEGQARCSWYVLLFQLPGLAESLYSGQSGRRRLLRRLRASGAPQSALDVATELAGDRARLRAMLQWYRALPLSLLSPEGRGTCNVPTTYAWSTGDVFLGRRGAERTAAHVQAPYRFEVLDGLTHWLPEQAPAIVSELILHRVRSVTAGA